MGIFEIRIWYQQDESNDEGDSIDDHQQNLSDAVKM
jgi:hypothetical protein